MAFNFLFGIVCVSDDIILECNWPTHLRRLPPTACFSSLDRTAAKCAIASLVEITNSSHGEPVTTKEWNCIPCQITSELFD